MPVKRWNFYEAKWILQKFVVIYSLNVDLAYQNFSNIFKKAAKKLSYAVVEITIYIQCRDAECESLRTTFLQSPQGDDSSLAATALLTKLTGTGGIDDPKQFKPLHFNTHFFPV